MGHATRLQPGDPMTDTAGEPGLRARRVAATRRAIGEAAIDLFVEKGFHETTLEDIAHRAGVSRRSIFNYFPTKQAAAFPDHEQRLDWLVAELAALEDVSFGAAADVIAAGVRDFAANTSGRDRYRLLMEIPELREQDMRDDLHYEDALTDYFLSESPKPTDDQRFDARRQAAQLVGAYRAALMTWATAGPSFDPADALTAAIRG